MGVINMDELIQRYLETRDRTEEKEELIERLKVEFLKDEMEDLFEKLGVEVKTSWTKDEIAEQMVSDEFFKKVQKEGDVEEEGSEEISEEESEGEEVEVNVTEEESEDLFSPDKLLKGFDMASSRHIQKFWEDLQKEVEKGMKDFKISPETYWKEVEKLWEKRSLEIQKGIERLAGTEIPEEDLDDLKEEWQDFTKDMSYHLKEIPIAIELRKNAISDIIERHTDESREIIDDSDKKMRDLYPLWFDMVNQVRDELEEGRNELEDMEEELYDTWDKFSNNITEKMKELAKEHSEKGGEILEQWNAISEEIDDKLSKIPEKHDHIYKEFWKNLGSKKPMLAQKIEEFTTRDYEDMIGDFFKPMKETFEKMIGPTETTGSKEKEIEELKERIAELEEKLEEE